MSICLMVKYEVPTPKSHMLPIATEAAFQKYWQPGCAALHLQWIPLFQAGFPLKQEDISLVIGELVQLKMWLSRNEGAAVPRDVVARIDLLVQTLQELCGESQAEVYIG